jgi:hypothetical protein
MVSVKEAVGRESDWFKLGLPGKNVNNAFPILFRIGPDGQRRAAAQRFFGFPHFR